MLSAAREPKAIHGFKPFAANGKVVANESIDDLPDRAGVQSIPCGCTPLADSYAARAGRSGNTGVISVAVFRERRRYGEMRPSDRGDRAPAPGPSGGMSAARLSGALVPCPFALRRNSLQRELLLAGSRSPVSHPFSASRLIRSRCSSSLPVRSAMFRTSVTARVWPVVRVTPALLSRGAVLHLAAKSRQRSAQLRRRGRHRLGGRMAADV